jgi:hypothetical protein
LNDSAASRRIVGNSEVMAEVALGPDKQPLPDISNISNNADSCQALFEDTSFFLPERGFLFRFLSFSLFSASTTTARL